MNFSHFLSMAPCWLPSPHPQGHIKHAHTSIWARFSNPHGDTSQMLVKGEMLTFVGSKHLLQSKHRLFLLNHPQQPSHNCFWPWNNRHLQNGKSKNGNSLFCKHLSSKFLLWDLNATIQVSAAVAVSSHSEIQRWGCADLYFNNNNVNKTAETQSHFLELCNCLT